MTTPRRMNTSAGPPRGHGPAWEPPGARPADDPSAPTDHPSASADASIRAIAIGASAGGVEALLRIASALPADFAPAVLIVLHRPAGQERAGASLAGLLAARCRLPVSDAWDRQPIEGGQVLLAPPDYHLLVDPGPVASLSMDPPVLFARPAIDPMFDTAAAVYGAALLGIVLSGANADGARGALAVRRRRGRFWVQDPVEASSSAMPQAALDAAGADEVLTLAQMCERFQDRSFRRTR